MTSAGANHSAMMSGSMAARTSSTMSTMKGAMLTRPPKSFGNPAAPTKAGSTRAITMPMTTAISIMPTR